MEFPLLTVISEVQCCHLFKEVIYILCSNFLLKKVIFKEEASNIRIRADTCMKSSTTTVSYAAAAAVSCCWRFN